MRPHKTDKAHTALRDRPADVSLLERRILILSDGKRHLDEVADLLGAQARVAMTRLLLEGYLTDIQAAAPPRPITPAPHQLGSTERAPQPIDEKSGAAGSAPHIDRVQPAAVASARRSIAAAKMYLIDMLQLQRGNEAAAIAASIRSCRDQDELAAHLLRALRHIHSVANASLSRRVADRLAEIMPEQYLAELDVFRDALFADRAATALL